MKKNLIIYSPGQFQSWGTLNDTIMGGKSSSNIINSDKGLLFEGETVSDSGGFVSCRSNKLSPPIDLSLYKGVQIDLDGNGLILKLAIRCKSLKFSLAQLISPNLRWVNTFKTNENGVTSIKIPFKSFKPAVRAKPVSIPIRFNTSEILQFQLLYSKFGNPGELNQEFISAKFKIIVRSISAYS